MAIKGGFDANDIAAQILSALDAVEDTGVKKAEDIGVSIGQAVRDGIVEGSKGLESEIGKTYKQFQNFVRSMNRSVDGLKLDKWKKGLGLAESLMKDEKYARRVADALKDVQATFNGTKVTGLENVLKEFAKNSKALQGVSVPQVKSGGAKTSNKPKVETPVVQADPALIVKAEEKKQEAINDTTGALHKQEKAIEDVVKAQKKLDQIQLKRVKSTSGYVDKNGKPIKYTPETYTALDGRYRIEKGTVGWNLYDTSGNIDEFVTAYDTLKELRDDLFRISQDEAKVTVANTEAIEKQTEALQKQADATKKVADAQKNLNEQIMKYVPRGKKSAVQDAYKDDDGYWITLKDGWEASNTDSGVRTIHSDTVSDLRYQISGIKKNNESIIKEYNSLMEDMAREHLTIGTSYSEGTDKWNLRDMVSEAQYQADFLKEIMDDIFDDEERAKAEADIKELEAFVKKYKKYIDGIHSTENHNSSFDNTLEVETETIKEVTQAKEKESDVTERATQALREQEAATESATKAVSEQNQITISSYQDLYKALEKVVNLSKQLKPEYTAEYGGMYEMAYKAGYPDSKESLIASIKAQYDNVQRIKASIKNGLSVYKDIDGDGYEATYSIDDNTLKNAENMLHGYIYQAVEYFGYSVADAMNDFDKKRIRTFVEKEINKYLEVSSKNDEYRMDAEAFNAPIRDIIESITDTIMSMATDAKSSEHVFDSLAELKSRPEDVNRYTLSTQANHIGSNIGLSTPYSEVHENAKKIETYEELCELVTRYNELQKRNAIFGGTEHAGLDEVEEMELRRLKARLEATGGKDIYKLSDWGRFDNVDKLADAMGIADKKAEEAQKEIEAVRLEAEQFVARCKEIQNQEVFDGIDCDKLISELSTVLTKLKEIAEQKDITFGAHDPEWEFEAAKSQLEYQKRVAEAAKEGIVYHAGVLGNVGQTMKSRPLGSVVPEKQGDYNSLTGLYTTPDWDGFIGNEWSGAPISTIDINQYKLFDARRKSIALQAHQFFDNLNGTIYGYQEYFDNEAQEMAKTTDVKSIESLYTEFKNVFVNAEMSFEQFATFIKESAAIVKGHDFEPIDYVDIDEGIGKSYSTSALQGVSKEIFNSDSFSTRLMKMLGYEGLDTRGSGLDSTYKGGTVIFDVKPESIISADGKWSELMSRHGVEIDEKSLENEKKRRQLAFDTAKAYSKMEEESHKVDAPPIVEEATSKELQDTFDIIQQGESVTAKFETTANTVHEALRKMRDALPEDRQAWGAHIDKMLASGDDRAIDTFKSIGGSIGDHSELYKMDNLGDGRVAVTFSGMYDKLIDGENKYQQEIEETARIQKERERQVEAFSYAAVPFISYDKYEAVSNDDKTKLFEFFVNKITEDCMSASDAMDQLYMCMEALRKQSETMPDDVGVDYSAEIQKLETHVNNLGEEFKNSEQYRDNFNMLVDCIKSGSISAAQAMDKMSDAYEKWNTELVGSEPKEDKNLLDIIANKNDPRVAKAFKGMDIKKWISGNVQKDARDELEGELYKLAQTLVDDNSEAYNAQLSHIAEFIVANFKSRESKEENPYNKVFEDLIVPYTDKDKAEMGEQLFEKAKRILGNKFQKRSEKNKHVDAIDQLVDSIAGSSQRSMFDDPEGYESHYNKFDEMLDKFDEWKQEGKRKTKDTYLSDSDVPGLIENFNETMRDQMVANIEEQQAILDAKTEAAQDATDNLNKAFQNVKSASSRAVLKGQTKADFEDFARQIANDSGMELGTVAVSRDEMDQMRIASIKLLNKELAQSITYTYDIQENAEGINEAFLRSSYAVGDANKALENARKKEDQDAKKKLQNDTWLYAQRGKLDTQQRRYTDPDRGIDGKLSIMSTETSLADDAEHTIESLANHIRENIKKSLSGSLTDEVKRQIISDLEILENEIKVRQSETYSSTTMKSSQFETNKKAYQEYMKAFTARAQKSGVFPQMSKTISDLNNELNSVSDAKGFSQFVDNFKIARNKFQAETAAFARDAKALQTQLSTLSGEESAYGKISANVRSIGIDNLGDGFKQKIASYESSLRDLRAAMDALKADPIDASGNLHKAFDDAALKAKNARVEIEGIFKQSQKLDQVMANMDVFGSKNLNPSELNNLHQAMLSFASSVEDGVFKFKGFNKAGTEMYGTLEQSSGAIKNVTVALKQSSDQLFMYGTNANRADNEWEEFKNTLASGTKNLVGMYVGFQEGVQAIRSGVEAVKQIDLAMTELKKVTDETDDSYREFLEDAGRTSAVIGSTVSDFAEASATFARLGYDLDEASSMAETAIVYKNVADGLDTVEESSESIISTMMAFGIEANDTMSIIDRFNAVGKIYADYKVA